MHMLLALCSDSVVPQASTKACVLALLCEGQSGACGWTLLLSLTFVLLSLILLPFCLIISLFILSCLVLSLWFVAAAVLKSAGNQPGSGCCLRGCQGANMHTLDGGGSEAQVVLACM